jgi:hypothetical protein
MHWRNAQLVAKLAALHSQLRSHTPAATREHAKKVDCPHGECGIAAALRPFKKSF